MTTIIDEILRLQDSWITAEIAQDITTLEKFMHDDVLCLLPGCSRIEGKTDFVKYLSGDSPKIESISLNNLWIKEDNNLAIKIADFVTHFADKRIPAVRGTHTWCLIKEREDWKIQMVTWTMKDE